MQLRLIVCQTIAALSISVVLCAQADTVIFPGDGIETQSTTADSSMVDSLLVVKSQRKLYLIKNGERIREMDIALGLAPNGHKQRSGDFRTPEGRYLLHAKNPDSDYFLSIHISYPNAQDRQRAAELGVDPGGQIMIHGLPNEPKRDERSYSGWDWTDGCIAVSNSDMIDIWLMTGDYTPIEIRR